MKLSKIFFLILTTVCFLSGNQIANAQSSVPALEYSDFVKDEPDYDSGCIDQRLKPSEFVKKMLAMKGFTFKGSTQKTVNVCDYMETEGDYFPVDPRQITVKDDSTYVRDVNGEIITITIQNYGGKSFPYGNKNYYVADWDDAKRYVIEFSNPEDAVAFDKLFLNNYFRVYNSGEDMVGPKEYKGDKVDSYLSLPEDGPHFRDYVVFFVMSRIKDKVRILSMVNEGD